MSVTISVGMLPVFWESKLLNAFWRTANWKRTSSLSLLRAHCVLLLSQRVEKRRILRHTWFTFEQWNSGYLQIHPPTIAHLSDMCQLQHETICFLTFALVCPTYSLCYHEAYIFRANALSKKTHVMNTRVQCTPHSLSMFSQNSDYFERLTCALLEHFGICVICPT